MITKSELQEAITEYERAPVTMPNLAKLTTLYTLQDYLYPAPLERREAEREQTVHIKTRSSLADSVNGKNAEKAWEIMAELIDALEVLQPRIHRTVLRKLSDL